MTVKQYEVTNSPFIYKIHASKPLDQIISKETAQQVELGYPAVRSTMSAIWRNSTRRQREWMVGSSRSSRVAIRTITTWGGGSSRVFRKAFWASSVRSAGS
jgi:hypothetical protein